MLEPTVWPKVQPRPVLKMHLEARTILVRKLSCIMFEKTYSILFEMAEKLFVIFATNFVILARIFYPIFLKSHTYTRRCISLFGISFRSKVFLCR
jgi:hypothetical protein